MALNVSLDAYVGKRVQVNLVFANSVFVREGVLSFADGKSFVLDGTPSGDRWIANRAPTNVLLAAHPKRITHIQEIN